jgi:TRAF3-interacting protein 1
VLPTCLLVLLVPLPAQAAVADADASAAAARERLLGLKAQVLRNEESLGRLLAMVAGGRN